MNTTFLIKRPIVTEKSVILGQRGQYVFEVALNASSAEIKKMLEHLYSVHVLNVRIINTKPRIGRYGRKTTVKRAAAKKAIVTLKEGEHIDVLPT